MEDEYLKAFNKFYRYYNNSNKIREIYLGDSQWRTFKIFEYAKKYNYDLSIQKNRTKVKKNLLEKYGSGFDINDSTLRDYIKKYENDYKDYIELKNESMKLSNYYKDDIVIFNEKSKYYNKISDDGRMKKMLYLSPRRYGYHTNHWNFNLYKYACKKEFLDNPRSDSTLMSRFKEYSDYMAKNYLEIDKCVSRIFMNSNNKWLLYRKEFTYQYKNKDMNICIAILYQKSTDNDLEKIKKEINRKNKWENYSKYQIIIENSKDQLMKKLFDYLCVVNNIVYDEFDPSEKIIRFGSIEANVGVLKNYWDDEFMNAIHVSDGYADQPLHFEIVDKKVFKENFMYSVDEINSKLKYVTDMIKRERYFKLDTQDKESVAKWVKEKLYLHTYNKKIYLNEDV